MRVWGDGTFSVGQLPMIVDGASLWYWDRLPSSYYVRDVIAHLAPDAQLYFGCRACGRHWRVNPSLQSETTCPCTPGRNLDPVKARPRFGYLCLDCGNEYVNFANSWDRPGRCPGCYSRKHLVTSVKAVEHRPDVIFKTARHRWAVNVADDLASLSAERDLVADLPEAELHLIPIALFAGFLQDLVDSPADKLSLRNFQANTLHESYKLTTDITAGWTALRLYWDAAREASGAPGVEAQLTHNVALAAYSLLALAQPLVMASTENGDLLRDIGLAAAGRAFELYDRAADRTRVRHVMGDLCATSESTLAEARQHYDAVLAAPRLPPQVRHAVIASRLRAGA